MMGDGIICIVVERVGAMIEEQIRKQVNLVRGVEKEVLNLCHDLNRTRSVLDDAERRGFKEKSVKEWLKRLEEACYEMDEVLDEWDYAIFKFNMEHAVVAAPPPKQKVWSFIPSTSCLYFKKVSVRHDIAKKIQNVKDRLDLVLVEKDVFNFVISPPQEADVSREFWRLQSTSLIELGEVHGRDDDTDVLVEKLKASGDGQGELGVHVMSIVGVGGLGKTTLAQTVYNDSRVKEHFELRIWICVSDPFDVVGIAKGIIESVKHGSSLNTTNQLEMLLKHVIESVSKKQFLLVLDDVWTEDYKQWEPLREALKNGAVGSKILVTTRNRRVAKMMGSRDREMHHLGQLSDEDCWFLLRRMALYGREQEECYKFQEIGKKIAVKCKGLPLAAKTLGSLLRFKNSLEEWENIFNNEIWELEGAEVDLFPHLLLSYNELSPTLKRCFSYCVVFPKDSEIDVERLIGIWIALGYLGSNAGGGGGDLELRGLEYFDNLAARSLFQDFEKDDVEGKITRCKMHDIVHDFAQFLRKNGGVEGARMDKATCQTCNSALLSHLKVHRSLFSRYVKCPPDFCDCITSVRVLGLKGCHMQSIPHQMENLIHLRWLDLSCNNLSKGDTQTIYKLYHLQFLWLSSCGLQELSADIENLIHLRHLDLSVNRDLKKLPESICGLQELRTLNITGCHDLCKLPKRIHMLTNLKHLYNSTTYSLKHFPQGVAQLTSLHTLSQFRGGTVWSNLGWLKKLNRLSGSLTLIVELTDGSVVDDAREAKLREKKHLKQLSIRFEDIMDDQNHKSLSMRMDVINALEPHPNLKGLSISLYKGHKLPVWMSSPLNQLRVAKLTRFYHLSTLPPLGELPCLETILISRMDELQFVGREFLDIQTSSSSKSIITFPKLKNLTFEYCPKWKEWEDITVEEEDSTVLSLMPSLANLTIQNCKSLRQLPQRLLSKMRSLQVLKIFQSMQLQQQFKDDALKSISKNNPRLQLIIENV